MNTNSFGRRDVGTDAPNVAAAESERGSDLPMWAAPRSTKWRLRAPD